MNIVTLRRTLLRWEVKKVYILLSLITLGLLTQKIQAAPTISNFDNVSFVEDAGAVAIAPNVTFANGTNYAEGYLEFELDNTQTTEQLTIKSHSNVNALGQVSLSGDSVYIGQGNSRKLVGKIDSTHNGQNGNKLRINFDASFKNGKFELNSLAGWKVQNSYYYVSGDTGTGISATASIISASTAGAPATSGQYVAKLYLTGSVTTNCGTAHGPVIESSEFAAQQGSEVAVDWRAQMGADDYDVYAYLLDKNTGAKHQLFYQRGAAKAWSTSKFTVPVTSSRFAFQFIGGTFDRTCGRAVGATLYIDNARQVIVGGLPDIDIQAIARAVTLNNTSNDPSISVGTRDTVGVTIRAKSLDGQIGSQNTTLTIIPKGDAPELEVGANATLSTQAIAPQLTLTDTDDTKISSALVKPKTIHVTDKLAIKGASQSTSGQTITYSGGSIPSNVSVTFDTVTKALTLQGLLDISVYQTILRLITLETNYPKQINFTVDDGNSDGTGIKQATDSLSILGIDYGDAWSNYATTQAQNGARHNVTPDSLFLGDERSIEINAKVDAQANADLADDGVYLSSAVPKNLLQDKTLTAGTPFHFKVKVSNDTQYKGKLSAWIDWNRDGDFSDTIGGVSEKVANDITDTNQDGFIEFTIKPPVTGLSEGATIARFRLSQDSSLQPTGLASDGEVEDYKVELLGKIDYGDAPQAYGDASHIITTPSVLYLGSVPDLDPHSLNTHQGFVDGLGDDQQNDDEDGLVNLPKLTQSDSRYQTQVKVTNQGSQSAYLVAWLDFNGNQIFEAKEATQLQVVPNTINTTMTLSWHRLPKDIKAGKTYLRLRLSTDRAVLTGNLNTNKATTLATDGEVEDHIVLIEPKRFQISGKVFEDSNLNAQFDTGELGIAQVLVILRDTTNNVCKSTYTKSDGSYYFKQLEVGQYQVYQAAQASNICNISQAQNFRNHTNTTALYSNILTLQNSSLSGANFGAIPTSGTNSLTFTPNSVKNAKAGSGTFHHHKLYVPVPGSVILQLQTPNSSTWGNRLFHDKNCDGQLLGQELIMVTQAIEVTQPKQQLCLVHAASIPVTAKNQESITIKAQMALGGFSPAITLSASVVDSTLVNTSNGSTGKLELTKTVRNVTHATQQGRVNYAKPGDILEYRIEYYNSASVAIEDLKINDTIPAFTELVTGNSTCIPPQGGGLTCLSTVESNHMQWRFSGVLVAGAKGIVTYQVRVQ